ncbi:SphA family protein [Paraburkholderia sp. HP33-1]|uniref:SphA family protein n=1 Tax=Paraburkholderia sp. HP33-1 TaxID=2883243 RepID=UPI001F1B4FF4|nr:transporter [Paraburkholderia sp. HP33-1]
MHCKQIKAALALTLAAASTTAAATENGLQSYPLGVNTVLNGILPYPGTTQFYNYTTFYTADRFAGPNGGSVVPGFKSQVFVDSPRVLHTWGATLGPVTMTSGLVVPVIHANISAGGVSDARWGLGDVVVHAMTFGYAAPTHYFFSNLALDFALPTGNFSASRLANTGLHSYAFMPNVSLTVFPLERVEVSATAGYEINSPNSATGYHSGNLAFLDWVAGYGVTSKLQVGVQGYALKQTTDDKLSGSVFDGGFRGRVYAIGPQIRYDITKYSGVVFKWQHEFGAQNRPQGEKIWLEFTFPL